MGRNGLTLGGIEVACGESDERFVCWTGHRIEPPYVAGHGGVSGEEGGLDPI